MNKVIPSHELLKFEPGDIVGQVWDGSKFLRCNKVPHEQMHCPRCGGKTGYRVREPEIKCWSWCCIEEGCKVKQLNPKERAAFYREKDKLKCR